MPSPKLIYSSRSHKMKLFRNKLLSYSGLSLSIVSFVLLAISLRPPKVVSFEVPESTPQPLEAISEAEALDADAYFSILIPALGANSIIVPNIDPLDPDSYEPALKEGVAHAQTSGFPGQDQSIFLFAHSTNSPLNIARFNAIFYDLDKLVAGDEIIIFYQYQKYFYKVSEKVIVEPDDLTWLLPRYDQSLILQTCYPPGTRQKRLLILAKPS